MVYKVCMIVFSILECCYAFYAELEHEVNPALDQCVGVSKKKEKFGKIREMNVKKEKEKEYILYSQPHVYLF